MKEQINPSNVPSHIAVIMDGNGRWARQQGAKRILGHQNATTSVRETVEAAAELKVNYLTLFAFSTENWNRPQHEINALMKLLVKTLKNDTLDLVKNNIKLRTVGDISTLPKDCLEELGLAKEKTAQNTGLVLNLALSYSGHWELLQAVKKMIESYKNGGEALPVTAETIEQNLETYGMPNPELLIRTSGEMRISNFMLWQMAYTELYFTKTLWPDFRKEDFFEAVLEYQRRERRFGKISEQI